MSGSTGPRLDHDRAEHNGTRSLCICSDDFGLHPAVNTAVMHLVDLGRVHALSAMVGAPAWPQAWALAREHDPARLDVGLHLDFTQHPLLPGSRKSLGALIGASLLHRLDRDRLRAEISAQLDAFERGMGRLPAYVDGHQHVHQLPVIRQVLLDELGQRLGVRRPWLRSTCSPRCDPLAGLGWCERFKAATIETLGGHGLSAMADRQGHGQNAHLLGVYDFSGGPTRYRDLLAHWLDCAREGDLLMCHPASDPVPGDPITTARMAEFEVLSSAATGRLLHAASIVLAPMSAILSGQAARVGPA